MFMAPPARLTPVTAVIHERGQRGGFHKAGGGKGPSSDDNPHACGAAARKGPSPITRRAPSQINYSGISVARGKKLRLVKPQVLAEQLAAAQSDILGEPIDFAFVAL